MQSISNLGYFSFINNMETHCNVALANARNYLINFEDALAVSHGPSIALDRGISGWKITNNNQVWFKVLEPTNLSASIIQCLRTYFSKALGVQLEVTRKESMVESTITTYLTVMVTEDVTRLLLVNPQNLRIKPSNWRSSSSSAAAAEKQMNVMLYVGWIIFASILGYLWLL